MNEIEYVGGISGSSGNCHLLAIPRLNTAVLFDIGMPQKFVKELLAQLDFDIEQLVVCISHEHGDHYNKSTHAYLLKVYPNVYTLFRKYKGAAKVYVTPELNIVPRYFEHGLTWSAAFLGVYKGQPNERFAYITDVDCNTDQKILENPWGFLDLDLLLIEANYDEAYAERLFLDPQAFKAYNYDVGSGFKRHLSKQSSEALVAKLDPKEVHYIHKSSRFYDWKGDG